MYHIFHSLSVDGHPGCFHFLAIVTRGAVNKDAQLSLWKEVFALEYLPRFAFLLDKLEKLKKFVWMSGGLLCVKRLLDLKLGKMSKYIAYGHSQSLSEADLHSR